MPTPILIILEPSKQLFIANKYYSKSNNTNLTSMAGNQYKTKMQSTEHETVVNTM